MVWKWFGCEFGVVWDGLGWFGVVWAGMIWKWFGVVWEVVWSGLERFGNDAERAERPFGGEF